MAPHFDVTNGEGTQSVEWYNKLEDLMGDEGGFHPDETQYFFDEARAEISAEFAQKPGSFLCARDAISWATVKKVHEDHFDGEIAIGDAPPNYGPEYSQNAINEWYKRSPMAGNLTIKQAWIKAFDKFASETVAELCEKEKGRLQNRDELTAEAESNCLWSFVWENDELILDGFTTTLLRCDLVIDRLIELTPSLLIDVFKGNKQDNCPLPGDDNFASEAEKLFHRLRRFLINGNGFEHIEDMHVRLQIALKAIERPGCDLSSKEVWTWRSICCSVAIEYGISHTDSDFTLLPRSNSGI